MGLRTARLCLQAEGSLLQTPPQIPSDRPVRHRAALEPPQVPSDGCWSPSGPKSSPRPISHAPRPPPAVQTAQPAPHPPSPRSPASLTAAALPGPAGVAGAGGSGGVLAGLPPGARHPARGEEGPARGGGAGMGRWPRAEAGWARVRLPPTPTGGPTVGARAEQAHCTGGRKQCGGRRSRRERRGLDTGLPGGSGRGRATHTPRRAWPCLALQLETGG